MTTDTTDVRAAALRTLDRLVGTWTVSNPDGLAGEVRYEWMDGGNWLVQSVDLRGEEPTRGVEYVGWDEDAGELRSHFFGAGGEHLEYTYRIEGDLLTIWFGGTDSPARFEGRFGADGTVNDGAWRWPGGGYASTMTRAG
ncbi:hypothetical protein [Geodermatophilus normandii]|uniref:DUF1579 domain-containing protein n=1 Tax=Geodermatophilus normandii TaxID=1137989 RepID=A0A6P0GB77_9ACTN|nr:hypothetical protein [Geodermatophilus normandii]NEM05150.1 hypothetical protein [Geodermatophilus normandii]